MKCAHSIAFHPHHAPRQYAARLVKYAPEERELLIEKHVPEHLREWVREYLRHPGVNG